MTDEIKGLLVSALKDLGNNFREIERLGIQMGRDTEQLRINLGKLRSLVDSIYQDKDNQQ
ncbi:hypothetical protein LCGC14_2927840 [marine sediment metagenome]|uniref:Uncharacterized protein n=1 Tax=marine sediment metagenome TaxID=412755 RepID=A0A0F8Y8M8_9ZZZZ